MATNQEHTPSQRCVKALKDAGAVGTPYGDHLRTLIAETTGCDQLLDAYKVLESSLAPYRGEDTSPERAYVCSRAAVQAIRDAAKGGGA